MTLTTFTFEIELTGEPVSRVALDHLASAVFDLLEGAGLELDWATYGAAQYAADES